MPVLDSPLAAGAWRLVEQTGGDVSAVHRWIDTSLELGIRSFDHADIYGDFEAEALFGRALSERPALRSEIELVSKCGIAKLSPRRPEHRVLHIDSGGAQIIKAVERSLEALHTDHLDVLLLHRPDPLMDPRDVAEAFVKLRDQGKVRTFGVSNHSVEAFALLESCLPFPLVTNQIELSLFHTSPMRDGTLAQLQHRNLAAMAWSPLAGGRLFRPETDAERAACAVISRLAGEYGVEPSAIAIAWLLRLPGRVMPIIGTSNPTRFRQAAAGAGVTLDRQDWFELFSAAGNFVA